MILHLGSLQAVAGEEPGDSPDDIMKLSLMEFIHTVVEQNLQVKSQYLESEVARWDVQREWGIFEPRFVVSATRNELERENNSEQRASRGDANLLFGGNQDVITTSLNETNSFVSGIEGLLPFGTQYTIRSSLEDVDANTNTAGVGEFVTFSGIEFTQPLLRNAGIDMTMARIRIAVEQTEVAFQRLRKDMIAAVGDTESFYWDMVSAQELYKLRDDSVKIAEKVLTDNRERVKAGKMSDLEVFEAETEVFNRKRKRMEAQQLLIDARNQLLWFIAESTDEWRTKIIATDYPDNVLQDVDIDYGNNMSKALALNPDYQERLHVINQDEIRLVFAKNQRWPQLDLRASYGLNGLGTTIHKSIRDIRSSQYDVWSAGIELRIPLGGGKQSESELEIAKLRRRRSLTELKDLEIQIVNRIDTLIHQIKSSIEQVRYVRKEVEFNQRLLDVELLRLEEGKSNTHDVFVREEELFDAKIDELTELVRARKTALNLELVKGTLLESRNIELIREN